MIRANTANTEPDQPLLLSVDPLDDAGGPFEFVSHCHRCGERLRRVRFVRPGVVVIHNKCKDRA